MRAAPITEAISILILAYIYAAATRSTLTALFTRGLHVPDVGGVRSGIVT